MVISTSTAAVVYCDYCTFTCPANVWHHNGTTIGDEDVCDWCVRDVL